MSQTILIKLTSIGVDNSSTFNIYSDLDNYTIPFETSISASLLLTGYTSNNVPDGTIKIKLKSTSGVCDYQPAAGIMINVVTQPAHTSTPTPTATPTQTPTPTVSPTPTPIPPTPTPTPAPITASYLYIVTSNFTPPTNTKTASNLCITQNSISYCRGNDTWNNSNFNDEAITGLTIGTYPLTISRNLAQNTVFTSYTQTITSYTVEVLVNSVSVFSTGYTYSPALTIPVSPSIDIQSVTTSGITLVGGENVEVIWSDTCVSPALPTATPTSTPTNTPTPTPTSTPVVPTPTPGGPTPTPTPTATPPTPTPTGLPSIITSGLTSYLNYTPPSYPGTGTTWTNIGLSGSTYDATLVASPTFTSGSPGFFDFNGTTQYATLAQAASGSTTGSYTLSAWVQVPTGATSELYITRGELAAPPTNYSLRLGKSGTNRFTAEGFTSSGFGIQGTTIINSSTWYNVTLRWISGTGLSLWVNGVKENEFLTTTTSLRTSTSVGWILMKNETTNYAPGKLSSVAMYFRNLSDAEILSNFNTLKSIYGY